VSFAFAQLLLGGLLAFGHERSARDALPADERHRSLASRRRNPAVQIPHVRAGERDLMCEGAASQATTCVAEPRGTSAIARRRLARTYNVDPTTIGRLLPFPFDGASVAA
jgi:hypothetical protein